MRPQDIVVLLKIIALERDDWYNAELALALQISPSEISEALNRCRIAGLMDATKRKVHRHALLEFLVYGLKYVFPALPATLVKGIPTAHSAPPLNQAIAGGSDVYVWASAKGTHRGQAIMPLYKSVPDVAQNDLPFYELLAITDAMRVGSAREHKLAKEALEKRLLNA